jgi:ribosomal protein RSM22 (predicted rRNA methylase)
MNMTTQSQFIYDHEATLAYLTEFFPSMYAINFRIMTEIKKRLPDFAPTSILDYGCGPGSASIAILDTWTNSINHVTGVDISDSMLEIANELMGQQHPHFKNNQQLVLQKYLPASMEKPYDLVVASYSLNELRHDAIRQNVLETLWTLTKDLLVVVFPGHAAGFEQLLQVREWVLSQIDTRYEPVAYTVAPCPHDRLCPLINTKEWCRFAQRSDKIQSQREIHGGCVSYMDERYSYIVLRRRQRPIITKGRPVQKTQGREGKEERKKKKRRKGRGCRV